jgi:hypothetical protein
MAAPRRIAPGHWKYGKWDIYYDAKPIPTTACDWNFVHEDYDGAPDANDNRCGTGKDVADCLNQIRDMEDA